MRMMTNSSDDAEQAMTDREDLPPGQGVVLLIRDVAATGALYFLLIFLAGTLAGIGRTLWLAPRIGAVAAVACEVPVMLAAVWISSSIALRVYRSPASAGLRFCIGAVAFLLLQIAEMVMASVIFGLDVEEYWRAIASLSGALGLAAQLFVLWAPVLQGRLAGNHRAASGSGWRRADLAQVKAAPSSIIQDQRTWRCA
jgi:hypothetical protein